MPILFRRFCTTSNAAIFSATKRTLLPAISRFAIIEVIVWDLPVPGGPCRTKLFPSHADSIAKSCDASAGIGSIIVPSSTLSPIAIGSASQHILPSIRLLTILFLCRSSARLRMSFHMTNCVNEKMPR